MRRLPVFLSFLPILLAACVSNPCSQTGYLHVRTIRAAPLLQREFFKLPMSKAYAIPGLPPDSPPLTAKNICMIVPPTVTPRPEKVPTSGTSGSSTHS